MTEEQFWEIIDRSREQSSDCSSQVHELECILSRLQPQEILEFDRIFLQKRIESYRWDLWGVANLIYDGCTDDSFEDFRSWLISRGCQAFEKVLSNPEAVLDLFDKEKISYWRLSGPEFIKCEGLGAAAYDAYESITNEKIPLMGKTWPSKPIGERWQEEQLTTMFPRVAARFHR